VALDDFGAGHTSLRHLQSLAVDMVKIDRAFIQNIAESPENQVFLRHLLGLAKGFGFSTVAEGIETADEAAILRREGVDFLQGFYYGRPNIERPWLAADPIAERAGAAD
jgi:EAL domain-containing protein (putative c-di-GMP-specific phosphodiesterase class I)